MKRVALILSFIVLASFANAQLDTTKLDTVGNITLLKALDINYKLINNKFIAPELILR